MVETAFTAAEFRALLAELAHGWTTRNYARVAARFAPDVAYADPVRYRLEGRVALRAFFEADDGQPQSVVWHEMLFDAVRQVGMAEYTYRGTQQYHGVVVLRLANGLITHWREYQHTDERGVVGVCGHDRVGPLIALTDGRPSHRRIGMTAVRATAG